MAYIISSNQLKNKLNHSIRKDACTLFSTTEVLFSALKGVFAPFKGGARTACFSGTVVLFYGILGAFRSHNNKEDT